MERQRQRRRRRTPLACEPCRHRKIRCDRNSPCHNCVTASHVCVFAKTVVPSSSRATDGDTTVSRASHDNNQPLQTSAATTPEVHLSGLSYDAPSRSDGANTVSPKGLQQADELAETSQSILQRYSGSNKSQIPLNKTKMLRFSHSMALTDQACDIQSERWDSLTKSKVAPIRAFFIECRTALQHTHAETYERGELRSLAFETAELLQKCKQLARIQKSIRPSRCLLSTVDFSLAFSSKSVADESVAFYLQDFESTHRIVHVPTFNELYKEYWKHSDEPIDTIATLLVHLVAALGSSRYLGQRDVLKEADRVIYAAQAWLSGPLAKDRLTLMGLQIYCLVILARGIFAVGGDLTWISAGDLLHRAMQMGLHRDPGYLPEMSMLEAETRRRLWATIVEILLQSSLDSAMGPRLSMEEFDTKAPANVNDADLGPESKDREARPMTEYTDTSTQLLLHSTISARLRALHLRFDLHGDLTYREALMLESDVVEASRAARRFLEDNKILGATTLDCNMVDYMLRRFLILLHFPFAMEANKEPFFEHSVQVCLDAGMVILYPEVDETFTRRLTKAGGMYREGLRMAIWVFSLPLLRMMEQYSVDDLRQDTNLRLHFLQKACEDMIALAAKRIEHGEETNINAHLFLSMVRAQVEAIYHGTDVSLAIGKGARDSAQWSSGVLCARDPALFAVHEDLLLWDFEADVSSGLMDSLFPDLDELPMQAILDF